MKISDVLVDCVVVSQHPEYPMQTFAEAHSPAFAGGIRVPVSSAQTMAFNERKIIARRAVMELKPNSVVNLGIGMPEGLASVAAEEKILDLVTLTAEPGVIGGIPAGGLNSAQRSTRTPSSTSLRNSISTTAAGWTWRRCSARCRPSSTMTISRSRQS